MVSNLVSLATDSQFSSNLWFALLITGMLIVEKENWLCSMLSLQCFSAASRKMSGSWAWHTGLVENRTGSLSVSLCQTHTCTHTIYTHTHNLLIYLFDLIFLKLQSRSRHAHICTFVPCLPANSYSSFYPVKLSPPLWNIFCCSFINSFIPQIIPFTVEGHGLSHRPEYISTWVPPLTCPVNLNKCVNLSVPHF